MADRKYLAAEIFPKISDGRYPRILFVGCRRYTQNYSSYFKGKGVDFWTTDIDPAAESWGACGRHLVCDIRRIDELVPTRSFDLVILNGIFGFGVDDSDSMNQALRAIHNILRTGGALLVGWNEGMTEDPRGLEICRHCF